MIDCATKLVGRQGCVESSRAQFIRISGHDFRPFRAVEIWQQAMSGQEPVDRAAALAAAPQLPANHSFCVALLIERGAVRIASFREDTHSESQDTATFPVVVMIDDCEADRGCANIKTENEGHFLITQFSRLAMRRASS